MLGEPLPRNFAVWWEWGAYYSTLQNSPQFLGYVSPGSWHRYFVFLETRTNPWRIQWYVDGTWLPIDRTAQVSFGWSVAASERQPPDPGLNWFWGLQRQNGTNNWANWGNMVQWIDTDPLYSPHKITNSEFKVY